MKKTDVKKYLQILKLVSLSLLLAVGMSAHVNVTFAATKNTKIIGKQIAATGLKSMRVAAVDLSRVLPYIMGAGDVFQGYEAVIYRNVQALKLRIFNQNSGRVRYVFVDAQTGQIL